MEIPERKGDGESDRQRNSYMRLGTADADGLPWASPVWYASASYREFFWVSKPRARHSRNVTVRPEVAIVIFDSTVPMGTGEGGVHGGSGGGGHRLLSAQDERLPFSLE
jgi:Pyridoxamine 5'-phosphate oxidase